MVYIINYSYHLTNLSYFLADKKQTMRQVFYNYLVLTIIYSYLHGHAHAKSGTFMNELTLDNLETYLSESENKYPDVIQGTEKKVVWHKPNEQTDIAVIYLHGFSASRQEITPIPEKLADSLSANLFMTRLRGHGRSMGTLSSIPYQDWQHDALEAYKIAKLIGKRVIIISTSTGGTLSTWLLNEIDNDDVIANVMLSPNFKLKRKSAGIIRYPFGLTIAKLINGPYHSFPVKNEFAAKYWTEKYKLEAVIPLLALMDEVASINKENITAPQIVLYSSNDKVVDTTAIVKIMKSYKNAIVDVIEFNQTEDPSHHILAGDLISPSSTQAVTDIVIEAVNKVLENN